MVAIGERELARLAGRVPRGRGEARAGTRSAGRRGAAVRRDHPKTGDVVAATQTHRRLARARSSSSHGIATLPPDERVDRRAARCRSTSASRRCTRRRRSRRRRSRASSTSPMRSPDLTPAEQEAWLERFNYASLANTAGARGDARTLAALDVHAPHARQGSPHLDRAESVSAAVVRAGRLGALRRADGARRGLRQRRSDASVSRS